MDTIGTIDKREQMLRLARLYYVEGVGQSQLAKQEGISKATVSRMLSLARENGFVTITVNDNLRDAKVLSRRLHEFFPTADFTVVSTSQNDRNEILDKVASSVAKYLDGLVKSGDIIGFGGGESLSKVAAYLDDKKVRDVVVLSLMGMVTSPKYEIFTYETGFKLANAYQSTANFLPLPVIFDNSSTKELVEKESLVRYLEKLGRLANIALISLDAIEDSPILNEMNYFDDEEKQEIRDNSVGDILGHFIDDKGNIVNSKLEERLVTTPLSNLKHKEHSIVAVNKVETVPALIATLKAQYCNRVFIDQYSAQVLIDSQNTIE
ncbi:sugar-binding transcriptional regulator [Lentilactobacillus sp. SPB1-3]|uniref:Sugar-binding transcriptional regulator n=1 Tax=Lentilactobacillus terminaliae TaxID=3003483 RepID=A0ACD5DFG6_9LACO|nr:sugar-binding domain-containing protein [Lentilactobacillus sp. SPB1-3]MCZ0976414.1 hypothetical protein [Lentilactobacillus sp. SPB1-3]